MEMRQYVKLNKLKSVSQKRKVQKDGERIKNEGSQVLTNLFSKKGERKRLNTQDETPFLTTVPPLSLLKQRQAKSRANNRLHFRMIRPMLLR